jgi:hypothetical protein
MYRKNGLMSIGIALIMLIFSLVAAMVLSNISSNLYKTIVKMSEGKEHQYSRIVVESLYNGVGKVNLDDLTEGATETFDFTFLSNEQSANPITFPATVEFIEKVEANYFVKLFTRHPSETDMYGIVAQY